MAAGTRCWPQMFGKCSELALSSPAVIGRMGSAPKAHQKPTQTGNDSQRWKTVRSVSVPVKALALTMAAVGTLLLVACGGGEVKPARGQERLAAENRHKQKIAAVEAELAKAEQKKRARLTAEKRKAASNATPAASAGSNGTAGQASGGSTGAMKQASSASFSSLESGISGEIGVAYAPLGSPDAQALGPLQVGHAWSSFKVPITATVMNEQNGSLTSGQEALAASAITASDNTAAAALFSELESITGGQASAAVERTLADAGAPTTVATAPPPPGAVSSWGQTEWELSAATRFYNALACGAYGGATSTVLGDMESVIPEQQWGLGQASFPAGASVAFKAGWGPDGSESGPYLVRQSGIIRGADGKGAVVTMAAQDSSGSFEAGVSDLDQVADWVAANVPLDGSC